MMPNLTHVSCEGGVIRCRRFPYIPHRTSAPSVSRARLGHKFGSRLKACDFGSRDFRL